MSTLENLGLMAAPRNRRGFEDHADCLADLRAREERLRPWRRIVTGPGFFFAFWMAVLTALIVAAVTCGE